MTRKDRSNAERIAGFEPFQVDVVIPVGPSKTDRETMLPLSLYVPKPLVPIGTRTMIWRILAQISRIEKRVNTVHLLVQKHRGTKDWVMVEKYLQELDDLPICQRFSIKINEGEMLCDEISHLEFKSPYFLLHFDDILLPNDAESFFEELIRFRLREEKKDGIMGTLAYSGWYPLEIGLIKQSQEEDRMHSLEEKSPVTLGRLLHRVGPGTFEEVCINMAISVFSTQISQHLEGKDSNFYQNIAELTEARFGIYEYKGKWYHVDTIHELHEQHVNRFKRWVD